MVQYGIEGDHPMTDTDKSAAARADAAGFTIFQDVGTGEYLLFDHQTRESSFETWDTADEAADAAEEAASV